jgi:hypothetical protein
MDCEIKEIINSVSEYGKLDVKFRLTQEEVIALKCILVREAHSKTNLKSISIDLSNVLLNALDRAHIKG